MTADTVGGVWDYSLQLAEVLAFRGVAVTLATMGPLPTRDQSDAACRIPGLELESRDYRLEWMDDPWKDVRDAAEWLLDLETDVRPDVVHLNGYAHGALPWRSPVIVVGHSCVCSWWEAVRGTRAPRSWTSYRHAVHSGIHAAQAVVAPTRSMANVLATHYGRDDVAVIPNGRDPRGFMPGPKAPFILSAGRVWDEAKNIRLLAAAAPRLTWPVYIAGEASSPLGCFEGAPVHLLGLLPSSVLRDWLACAAVYVLPAKYEPFGLSVLEAALSECALVLGDIPSLRENWDGAAIFVPTDDREALTACLNDLATRPELVGAVSRNCRRRALELTPERMGDRYLELYSSVRSAAPLRQQARTVCAS